MRLDKKYVDFRHVFPFSYLSTFFQVIHATKNFFLKSLVQYWGNPIDSLHQIPHTSHSLTPRSRIHTFLSRYFIRLQSVNNIYKIAGHAVHRQLTIEVTGTFEHGLIHV